MGEQVEVGDGVVVAGASEESDDDDAGCAALEGVLDGDVTVGALLGIGMGLDLDSDRLEVEEVVALERVEVADDDVGEDSELSEPVGTAVGGDDQCGSVERASDERGVVDLAGEGDDGLHVFSVAEPPLCLRHLPPRSGGKRVDVENCPRQTRSGAS